MDIAEAERKFTSLVDAVTRDGITVDLEQGDQVVARIAPTLAIARLHSEIMADLGPAAK